MLRNEAVDVDVLVVDILRNIFAKEREKSAILVRRESSVVTNCISRAFSCVRGNVVIVVVSECAVGFHVGGFFEGVGYEGIIRRRLRREEILRHGGCAR